MSEMPAREFELARLTRPEQAVADLRRVWVEQSGVPGAAAREEHGGHELVFLDSFDALVRGAGLVCSWQGGLLRLSDRTSGEERAAVPIGRPERPLPAAALPAGRLRALLAPVLELRALLALGEVRATIASLALLAGEGKTVVRAHVIVPESRGLGGRIVLEPLRGYDREAARAASLLERELSLEPAAITLEDESITAAGHPPGGVSAKVSVALEPDQRADEAAAVVLRALLDVIEANLSGTLESFDPEFLHDLRVSVRRSRAVQRELRRVFPTAELAHFRSEFRWLQQATGDARDLDVYVHELDEMAELVPESMRAQLAPLGEVLAERRARAHRECARALRSERAVTLLREWRRLLDRLAWLAVEDRPWAERPIGEASAERISRVYRQMLKVGEAIGPESPPSDYHELRKKGKELRYLLELFGAPLHPDGVVAPMVKALKGLQDVLGLHQDREVQQATLHELREELAARPGGADALLAVSALMMRLADQERAARERFAESFAKFASPAQRKLVKRTFR